MVRLVAILSLLGWPAALAASTAADKPEHGPPNITSQPAAPGQSKDLSEPTHAPRYPTPAHAALANGEPRRVLELLDAHAARLPLAERRSLEGRAYFLLGDYSKARKHLESAVGLRPNHAEDLYWLGRAYAASGLPSLAAARFEEAAWNGMQTADLHYHFATALLAMNQPLGRVSQKRVPEKSAEAVEPGTFALGGFVIGTVITRPGRVVVSPPNSAIYQVYRALALDGERGEAWLLAGRIWSGAGRHEQAVACFARAAHKLPPEQAAAAYEGWAAGLLALGDLDGYLEQSWQCLRLKGRNEAAELARCYDRAAAETARRGDLKGQVRYLKLGADLDPQVDRLLALADALLQGRKPDEAIRYLQLAKEQQPDRAQRQKIEQKMQIATYLAAPR